MSRLRRLVLVRHGETDGDSSVRFHGSGDVALSDSGRTQMREVARRLRGEPIEAVVSSPLRRAWEAAWIAGGGAQVRLEADFREIHFGRWEGLTREEIEATDPVLYRDWQSKDAGFEFPSGERRADFRARVERGLEGLLASRASHVLVVVHKGVIRAICESLLGRGPEAGQLELGGVIALTRDAGGSWFEGRRGSDPEGVNQAA
jgi:broad specificity phosphatase PhoE